MAWRNVLGAVWDTVRSVMIGPDPEQTVSEDTSESSGAPCSTHDANLSLYESLKNVPNSLPDELILQILDDESRWVCSFSGETGETEGRHITVRSHRNGDTNLVVLLATTALSSIEISRLRKVVFRFTSHDQGWSSYPQDRGTFENSWTWFEAALRRDSTVPYERFELQRNRHSGREPEPFCIELDQNSSLVRHLRPGDTVELLGCAQFAGWENRISYASIELWSYDDLLDASTMSGVEA